MRKSGINVIGDIPWGTHFSQFYETKEDLIEILVPYFKAGLDNNEFCMWVTSEPLKAKEAKAALRKTVKNLEESIKKGQIEILDASQWYMKEGKFEADRVLKGWIQKEKRALKRGFDGLRLSGNTFWLERGGWKEFIDYEEKVQNLIGDHRMIAVCSYSLQQCALLEAVDVASHHRFSLVKKKGRWTRIENIEDKKKEEALRQSEQQYKRIFEFSPEVIGIIDNEGNILDVNKRLYDWLGYKPKEVVGKNFLELPFLTDESKAVAKQKLSQSLLGEEIRPYELHFITKRGEKRVGRILAGPIRDKKGDIIQELVMASDITERKQAEEKLVKEKAYLDRLFESAQEGIVMADKEGRVMDVNDEFVRMFGYEADEVVGRCVDDLVAPKNNHNNAELITKKTARGEKIALETVRQRKDGKMIDVSLLTSPIVLDGQVVALYAIYRDITERNRTEEAVRKRKSQLELVHSIQNDIPMNMDIETILKSAAESIGRSFGYNKVSVNLFGEDTQELMHIIGWNRSGTPTPRGHRQKIGEGLIGKAAQLRKTIIANDVSKEPSYVVFYQTKTKSELTIPLIVQDHLVGVLDIQDIKKDAFKKDDVPVLQALASYIAYVINEKQIEEVLRVSEEKYRNLVELSPDAILFLDMNGVITSCNTYMIKATGYSKEEIVGKNLRELEFLSDEDIPEYIKLINKAAKGKIPKPFEVIWHHKDGTSYLAEVRVGYIQENVKNVGLQVVARDMTERKKAEELIKTSLKEKEVMLREIHHRVKNNMQIVSSLLRLQSRQIADEKIMDMFNVGQNRIRSMALIHESLYQSNDLARINFSDYIKRLTTHLFSIYRTEMDSIDLRLNVKDVFLDINRAIPCGLVINELISNSLKHAFPDGKKGEIVVEMDENKRGQCTLIISDSGIGFPEGLDFQNTETLGMQLVTDLVRQLDGRIKISRLKGTEFKIAF